MRDAINRRNAVVALFTLLLAGAIVYLPHARPSYTDAFYHYNAAVRLAQGDGFVDDYLWTYIGAPQSLPARSHLYWMPGTSVIAAIGMLVFGVTYPAAQIGLMLCLWGGALLTFHIAMSETAKPRHALAAAVVVLFGGFFGRFWGATDTFAPYLLFGGAALWLMQQAIRRQSWQAWLLCGMACGAGHFIRSDGLLLVMTGALMLMIVRVPVGSRLMGAVALIVGYLLAMGPWFAFNYATLGTLLPTGGTQAIWYTSYDDLFSYPPDANPTTFFADGVGVLLSSRMEALVANAQTLLFVQGMLVLAPFMLVAMWLRRRDTAWWPIFLFAAGLHAAFTFVFPFPGMRGGLFHGVAALMPFWAVLAFDGMDRAIVWVSKWRRHWNPRTAQPVFTVAAVIIVILFSVSTMLGRTPSTTIPDYYVTLQEMIPAGSRVMRNDPSELYYFTGISGVVLPNEPYNVVETIVQQFAIDYVMLEYPNVPAPLRGVPVPAHWQRIPLPYGGVELYDTQRAAP